MTATLIDTTSLRRPQAPARRRGRPGATPGRLGDHLTGYGFLLAALICFALFSWYPIIRGILLSFQQVDFVNPPSALSGRRYQQR